jgi:hypothetical protein
LILQLSEEQRENVKHQKNYQNVGVEEQRHFQQYFSYIMATSFSGGKCRSNRTEPPTMGK